MILKEIEIDGKMVSFRASATVPRLYRAYFNRDIFADLQMLQHEVEQQEADEEKATISIPSLEVFENVAFVMAKHADGKQPNTADEWLEQFDTFSIYEVLPELLDLWHLDNMQMSESKKKFKQVTEK